MFSRAKKIPDGEDWNAHVYVTGYKEKLEAAAKEIWGSSIPIFVRFNPNTLRAEFYSEDGITRAHVEMLKRGVLLSSRVSSPFPLSREIQQIITRHLGMKTDFVSFYANA